MKTVRALLLGAVLGANVGPASAAEDNRVVTSIKPVHSLVAAVMDGVGEPHLIVRGAGSPHTYSLRPSDASALQGATVVIWIGHELESFLESSIESLASKAHVVALSDVQQLAKLKFRQDGAFEAIADDSHDEHGEDEHGEFDMHFWLDPANAKAMVRTIEGALSRSDPDNAAAYKANAKTVIEKISSLEQELAAMLGPVQQRPFMVFHDGYQYFEKRFGLTTAGSITVSPEKLPGARRLRDIQAKIRELGVACVFAEPQFKPKLVETVTQGTQARPAMLDPLGSGLDSGPQLYFELMRTMARSVKDCLSNQN